MKKTLKYIIVALGILSTLAFKIGDELELTQFMNARSHPNFIKKTNIVKTLKTGTTGEVSDIKRFHSGNFGFKMKLTSGPFTGETHWVYYNVKSPGMVLATKKGEEIPEEKVDENIVETENINSKLEEDTNGHLDPIENELIDIVDFPKITQDFIKQTLNPKDQNCIDILDPEPKDQKIKIMEVDFSTMKVFDSGHVVLGQSKVIPQKNQSIPLSVTTRSPIKNNIGQTKAQTSKPSDNISSTSNKRPVNKFQPPICGNRDTLLFVTCYANGKLEKVAITNSGPNSIVPDGKYNSFREFSMNFNDNSLSDSILMLTESPPSNRLSASTYTVMMHFPRTQVPTVSSNGKEIEMTLSNGEVVKFDAATKKIISGPMSEVSMKAHANGKALAAGVKYSGEGVMIRADRNNGLPHDHESRHSTMATVSKKGFKDCKILSSQIWYNDPNLNRILIKAEYSTDEGLNKLLRSKCGFTIN